MTNLRRLAAAAGFSLSFTAAAAINSAAIVSSTPQCLEYKVVGICYWLLCGPHGCKVKTSVKVRHYVPDAVVSSYANTGSNPWTEVSALGTPNPSPRPAMTRPPTTRPRTASAASKRM